MKSVMQHNFATIEAAQIQRSSFDLSHGHKTTFDADYLIPFVNMEILPGDTINLKANILARLATPIHPIMDNIHLDTFWFAVPMRQVWDNFQKFMGEQIDPGDSIDFTIPQMVSTATTGYLAGSIHDYFGLPTEIPDLTHSALFHRAYYLCWNHWFRDQNLQDSLTVSKADAADLPSAYTLQKRGKRHDYFTSCLPAPQRGTAISMSLGTTAPIFGDNMDWDGTDDANNRVHVLDAAGGSLRLMKTDTTNLYGASSASGTGQLLADLTNATASTINALRLSVQLQAMLERDARGGTRYPEILKSHFGVVSPDARLQRPEFLGGSSNMVNISPLVQTSETNTTDLGTLGATGVVTAKSGFTKSFVEHTLLIGMVSARADISYQQGLDRMWSRLTRYDHYFPGLAHLGEQAVLNKEILAQGSGDAAADIATFGYQERWAELRHQNSKITGQFRSNHATSLDSWHLSQDFASLPVLDTTFITETVPLDRVIATPAEPHFIFDSYIEINAVRPMPIYSIPGFGATL